jgi:hypothetical protein
MARYFLLLVPVLLSGCFLPPALIIASYAADGVSYSETGKSVEDHGLSAATGEDCAMLRIVRGHAICRPEAPDDAASNKSAPNKVMPNKAIPVATSAQSQTVAIAARGWPPHRYLVLGSFSDEARATQFAAGISAVQIKVEPAYAAGKHLYRVIAGPLRDDQITFVKERYSNRPGAHIWEIADLSR